MKLIESHYVSIGYSLKYLIQQNIIQDQNIIGLFKTEYEGCINTKINQKKIKINIDKLI